MTALQIGLIILAGLCVFIAAFLWGANVDPFPGDDDHHFFDHH